MSNEHLVLCGGARERTRQKAWREATVHRLSLGRSKSDVHLQLSHITRSMASRLPSASVDLLEIASYVYVADQCASRGGSREFDYGAKWRRHWRFNIPVRCPDLWSSAKVKSHLERSLSYISDDQYEFVFSKLQNPVSAAQYVFDWSDNESAIEEVVLFSGGLDSLSGAVQEIIQSQRIVNLVSHRSSTKRFALQKALVSKLGTRAGHLKRPLHTAVRINKGVRLGGGTTQRTRSFLFGAIAAVVAEAHALSRVRFYENGVTSMNLPISSQLIGARASRTTHPQSLNSMGDLYSLVFGRPFAVENPYLWKTKTDVLKIIKLAACADMCAATSSCGHTWEMTRQYTHCGRCSQCVDRRLSAAAAGFEEEDDPGDKYRLPVLLGERTDEDLTVAERYIGAAQEFAHTPSPDSFASRFGEVSRILRHVGEPCQVALKKIYELHQTHGRQICEALNQIVERHSATIVSQCYPKNSLFGLVVGRSGNNTTRETDVSPEEFKKIKIDEDQFSVSHCGKSCDLYNTKEFEVFKHLAKRINCYVTYEELRNVIWDGHALKNTIQRAVCNLRAKLNDAQIKLVIDGTTNRNCYALKVTNAEST